MALGDIVNYVPVTEQLGTAGQPSETQLAEVRADGYEVVVNLGLLDPRYCLPDEAATVAALGMDYHHIPVDFAGPTAGDYERFLEAMRAAAGRRVFVHCAMNMRVSCFTALYGEDELGWTREQAEAHIARLWTPNPVWRTFLEAVRARRASLG